MKISEEAYRRIEEVIASDDSPVGIDAKKTHVMILHQLARIEKRLKKLEKKVRKMAPGPDEPAAS